MASSFVGHGLDRNKMLHDKAHEAWPHILDVQVLEGTVEVLANKRVLHQEGVKEPVDTTQGTVSKWSVHTDEHVLIVEEAFHASFVQRSADIEEPHGDV